MHASVIKSIHPQEAVHYPWLLSVIGYFLSFVVSTTILILRRYPKTKHYVPGLAISHTRTLPTLFLMDASIMLCTLDASVSLLRLVEMLLLTGGPLGPQITFKNEFLQAFVYLLSVESSLLQGSWLLYIIARIISAMRKKEMVTSGSMTRPLAIVIGIWLTTAILPLILWATHTMKRVGLSISMSCPYIYINCVSQL